MNSLPLFAQTMEPPGREWYKSYWPDENMCDDESNQIESGEDWFYDVSLSKDIGGTNEVNGLICTGYQVKQSNLISPLSCQLTSTFETSFYCELRDKYRNAEPGLYRRGTVWFLDLEGHEKWYIDVGEEYEILEGRKIIQTYDGNYIMVGDGLAIDPNTAYTAHIPYNPGVSSTIMLAGGALKGIIAKIDASTHEVMWLYAYALEDDFETVKECAFSDVVEDPDSKNLIVSGRAQNADGVTNAVIFNLEEDGDIIWKSPITSESTTFSEFNCLKLVIDGSDKYITACGAEAPQGLNYTNRFNGTKSYLANFEYNSSVPGSINYGRYGTATGSKVNFIYDFEYLSNGKLIVPSIEDCSSCPYYSGMPQHTKIYDVNPSTFSVIASEDLGALAAYDMQSGIDKTADGGFVFVSTRRAAAPSNTGPVIMDDGTYVYFTNVYPYTISYSTSGSLPNIHIDDCPNWFWYTDAYVAKFADDFTFEWENTYPFTTYDQAATNRGEITQHECLYEIVQLPDGSFIAAGNNSANLDDHILLKINDDCENRQDGSYYIGNGFTSTSFTQHITSNATWSTNRKIRGTVIIDNGVTLTINGATIEFADTRKTDMPTTLIVDKGGRLIVTNGATLTAISSPCTGGVWDGIQVYGEPASEQTPSSNQGYCLIENSTIEHARIGVRLSASYYEPEYYWYTPMYYKTGGIIETNTAHFVDNWKDVEFMKYNSPTGIPNVSHFDKTEFLYTGGFPKQDYFMNHEGEYMGYKDFVTLWDVQGVSFLGCSFVNTTADYMKHRGTGISSINATYNVNDYIQLTLGSPIITHTSFTNIFRGIQAFMYSAVIGPTLNISNAVFDHVRQGIGISGFTIPYPIISNNTIKLETDGSILHDQGDAWGIHATGCEYYYIQENQITSDFIPDEDLVQRSVVGIAVNNRHDNNTIVYKNSIELMRTAILPFGWNGTEGSDYGLLLKCNELSDNFQNDIKVVNDGGVDGAIKDNQGGCTSNLQDDLTPAGNSFTDLTGGSPLIHINTATNVAPFNYYYRNASIPETPVTYTTPVTPIGCVITYLDDELCPTKIVVDNGEWSDDGWDWHEKIAEQQSEAGQQAIEKLYFNHLMNTNHTADIVTYLHAKSPKSHHDSLNLYYAFTALRQYDSALAVLNSITNVDNTIAFLKKMTQQLKGDSISYHLRSPFTDSLYYWISDSTNIQSIYAENILRLTSDQYYPFRIPQDDSGSNKTQIQTVKTNVMDPLNYVALYPNPNSGSFTVSFERENMSNIYSIGIFDALGRKVYSERTENNKFSYQINLAPNPGAYFLRVYSNDGKEDQSRIFSIK